MVEHGDARLARALLESEKDRREHQIVRRREARHAVELAQPLDVKEWKKGEVHLIPGKTAPQIAVVERDYPAVYERFTSLGPLMNKGLTFRAAQQHGQAYVPRLLEHAVRGELDTAYLATHHFSLEDAPRGYELFKTKEDGCVRAVFKP